MPRKTKYSCDSSAGESESTTKRTIPADHDEVLSERHYSFGPLEEHGRRERRRRDYRYTPAMRSYGDYRGCGPKGYRRSDESLREAVCEALYRSSEVDATDIEVVVARGVVTLKGWVLDRSQKKSAEDAVDDIPGVVDVYNDLVLRDPRVRTASAGRFGLTDNITGLN